MRIHTIILVAVLACSACSAAQVKTAGQGAATAGIAAGAATLNPGVGVLAGIATFFGFEYTIAQDAADDAEAELEARLGQSVIEQVFAALWNLMLWCAAIVLAYFVGKAIYIQKFASPRNARRIEEWEDRLERKIKDRLGIEDEE
jgi:hypothetical protein